MRINPNDLDLYEDDPEYGIEVNRTKKNTRLDYYSLGIEAIRAAGLDTDDYTYSTIIAIGTGTRKP